MLAIKTHFSLQNSWPVQWPWEGHTDLCWGGEIWWPDLHRRVGRLNPAAVRTPALDSSGQDRRTGVPG